MPVFSPTSSTSSGSTAPEASCTSPIWTLFHLLLIGFGAIGLAVLIAARRPEALLIAAILVAITLIGMVLVASPRRVLVAVPLIAPLAGAGAVWSAQALRRRLPDPGPGPRPTV